MLQTAATLYQSPIAFALHYRDTSPPDQRNPQQVIEFGRQHECPELNDPDQRQEIHTPGFITSSIVVSLLWIRAVSLVVQ